MTGAQRPGINDSLPGQNWESLLQQTLRFATYQVNRLRWRGDTDGILPHGYDPSSIAAQAILEFLKQHPFADLLVPSSHHPSSPAAIQYELNRLVLKHVSRLHHLKENFITCNDDDLAPVQDIDAEFVSALELISGPDIQPDDALIQKELTIGFYQLKQRFEAALADQPLRNLLDLGCNGVCKPRALAEHLNLPVRTIYSLRARLQRAWLRFVAARALPN